MSKFAGLTQLFLLIILALAGVLTSPSAQAKVFRNAYVSFELPDKWDCLLQGTEWVCRTSNPGVDTREAVIVLTAKEVGPSDSLPAYEEHLKRPKTVMNRSAQPVPSQVLKVETRKINNFPWVDGFHLASEVPNYYTRYLATTKEKIAVVVTFSAYKTVFTKYSADFFRAIESLNVIASRSLMESGRKGIGDGGAYGGPLGPGGAYNGDAQLPEEMDAGRSTKSSSAASVLLGLALIVGALGVYIYAKRG